MRTHLFRCTVVLTFIFAVFVWNSSLHTSSYQQVSAQSVSSDWPQVQHDVGHTGYISDTYGPPFSVLWRFDHSKTPSAPPISIRVQPVVAYNFVYLPSNDGSLYAIKTADGKIGWTYKTNMPLVNAAAVDTTNNIVTVGSTDHYLYALNATTGTKLWSYQTSGMIRSAPVISGNVVYIANTKGMTYALNILNGQTIWQTQLDDAVLDTPAFSNGSLFVGTFSSNAYSLNGQTGQIQWKKQLSGQGFRDRWISAGNNVVFFNPVPLNNGYSIMQDGVELLTPIATSDWSTQKQAILNYINKNPANKTSQILDMSTGAETDPPILYTSGGSNSEHTQPVILPSGNFNVIYRYTEGKPNPGCGATCIVWSIYLGEYNKSSNDIVNLDTWGSGTNSDPTKKIFSHTDESTQLMRTGSILYVSTSRGILGFDIITKTIVPFVVFDEGAGSAFSNSPIAFYSSTTGWPGAYPGAEVNSDGNDYSRPLVVANDVFYILHNSELIAVKATKR